MTLGLALSLAMLAAGGAQARSLQSITAGGTLTLCAHPNALPYASRHGDLPGLQVEIAEALARQIGVSLNRSWVFSAYQFRRAGCDIVLDAIGDRASLGEVGLRASRPYHKSGLTLAVRGDSSISALADLGRGSKVIGGMIKAELSREVTALADGVRAGDIDLEHWKNLVTGYDRLGLIGGLDWLALEGARMRVAPLEAVDGTPVLDVKPVL